MAGHPRTAARVRRTEHPCACSPRSTSSPPPPARSSAPATGSPSTRTASTCSPMPPATTSGSTSTSSGRRPARSAAPSPTATSRCRCVPGSAAQVFALDTPGAKLNYGVNKVRFPAPAAGRLAGPRPRLGRRGHRPAGRQAADAAATRSRSRASPSPPASPRRSSCSCPEPARRQASGRRLRSAGRDPVDHQRRRRVRRPGRRDVEAARRATPAPGRSGPARR